MSLALSLRLVYTVSLSIPRLIILTLSNSRKDRLQLRQPSLHLLPSPYRSRLHHLIPAHPDPFTRGPIRRLPRRPSRYLLPRTIFDQSLCADRESQGWQSWRTGFRVNIEVQSDLIEICFGLV